jgi:hypothetical protein
MSSRLRGASKLEKRFVEQHGARVLDQGTRDRDPLALAARKLTGVPTLLTVQSHPRESIADTLLALLSGHGFRLERERQVAVHRQVGPQREILEHHGEISFFWWDQGATFSAAVCPPRITRAIDSFPIRPFCDIPRRSAGRLLHTLDSASASVFRIRLRTPHIPSRRIDRTRVQADCLGS